MIGRISMLLIAFDLAASPQLTSLAGGGAFQELQASHSYGGDPVTVAPLGIWLVARSMALVRSQIDSAVTEPARAGAGLPSSNPAAISRSPGLLPGPGAARALRCLAGFSSRGEGARALGVSLGWAWVWRGLWALGGR